VGPVGFSRLHGGKTPLIFIYDDKLKKQAMLSISIYAIMKLFLDSTTLKSSLMTGLACTEYGLGVDK